MFKILVCKCLLLIGSSSTKSLDSITQFAQKTYKKPAAWHQQKIKSVHDSFHNRFENFLVLFLNSCKTINRVDQLAQAIMTLSLIKQHYPKIFEQYKLADLLIECFKQAATFKPLQSITLFELQPYFDFWYFAQSCNKNSYTHLDTNLLKKIFSRSKLRTINDPVTALVMLNYLIILKSYKTELYKPYKKYIPSLTKVTQKDPISSGYLLICQLLYQHETIHRTDYCKELIGYCSTTSLQSLPIDLIAQLYACCKFTKNLETPPAKSLAILLSKQNPETFQEICAFTLAAC